MSPMEIAPDLRAGHSRNLERRHAAGRLRLDLDLLVVHFAVAQLAAERLARRSACVRADQRIEHALFGGDLCARLYVLALALACLPDRDLDQVANDLFDIAADITHLGELGRLHLDEGRSREPGKAAGNFGLADAGRADHQDVLRQHFLAQRSLELQSPPPVSQRDRDRALGVGLSNDESVEFGDDFAGGKVGHVSLSYCPAAASASIQFGSGSCPR